VGSFRGGGGVLVRFPGVLPGSQTIRQTVGRHATDPEEIRRHGHRDIHRPAGVSAGGQVEGTRIGHAGNDIVDKEELHGQIVGHREVGAGHARGKRYQRRVPRDPTSRKSGNR